MANKFKTGDLVQLKSGGPAMTVDELSTTTRYRCVWFKGASREQGVFSEDSLQTYVPLKIDD
ncbi:YodC family protein [Rhizobium leguminosarum]|uniref:YodC family protein n=1 Tax=Rhizobium leguminosarum TaxID=384 RepID=UPI003F98053D